MITALTLTQQVCRLLGWPIPSTIEGDLDADDKKTSKVLEAVNLTGQMLASHYYWRWLHKEASFRTTAEYTTGDADVTQGSPSVTSSSATAWTAELIGRSFKTAGYQESYTVDQVLSATSLVLDQPFNGDDNTDQSYSITERRYPVEHDFDSELGIFQFLSPRQIELIDPVEMNRRLFGGTSTLSTGNAIKATIYPSATDGRLEFVLDPTPDTAYQVAYSYYALLNKFTRNSDFWPFSVKFEPVLLDGSIHILRHHAQDDNRSRVDLQKFFNERGELSGLQRPTDIFTRFQPDAGVRRTHRSRRRVSSGRYDLGEFFDRTA